MAVSTVYVCVPRGVNIGEIAMQSDAMSWNTTKRTYQLKLKACIPVYNPNFFEVCKGVYPPLCENECMRCIVYSVGQWLVLNCVEM